MIHYRLQCPDRHVFDGWFPSSSGFEAQAKSGAIACPTCGSTDIRRALMTPAVTQSRRAAPTPHTAQSETPNRSVPPPSQEPVRSQQSHLSPSDAVEARAMARAVRAFILSKGENWGRDFPSEARRIHYGKAPDRGIYGEVSSEEAADLIEEGINIVPLPAVPEDHH